MTRGRVAGVIALAVVALAAAPLWREHLAWRVAPVTAMLRRVPATRLGLCRCAPDSTISLRRDGLRLSADVYATAGAARAPVLLLHGLTPAGNDLPIYHVLARRLADDGLTVVALDFAGYGDSDDPYALGSEEALDAERDVDAALAAIDSLAGGDAAVTVVGHSMGGFDAMAAGLDDERVGAVVAIGPPRRTAEVLATEAGREYHWHRIRRTYDSVYHRPLPAWFTRERFLALKAERNIDSLRDGWREPGHVPLLLVDGEREAAEDRAYLRRYAAELGPAARLVTIDDADHYLNSGRVGGLLYYDRDAVDSVVTAIRAWAAAGAARRAAREPSQR